MCCGKESYEEVKEGRGGLTRRKVLRAMGVGTGLVALGGLTGCTQFLDLSETDSFQNSSEDLHSAALQATSKISPKLKATLKSLIRQFNQKRGLVPREWVASFVQSGTELVNEMERVGLVEVLQQSVKPKDILSYRGPEPSLVQYLVQELWFDENVVDHWLSMAPRLLMQVARKLEEVSLKEVFKEMAASLRELVTSISSNGNVAAQWHCPDCVSGALALNGVMLYEFENDLFPLVTIIVGIGFILECSTTAEWLRDPIGCRQS